jgi:hypothetical protein
VLFAHGLWNNPPHGRVEVVVDVEDVVVEVVVDDVEDVVEEVVEEVVVDVVEEVEEVVVVVCAIA